MHRNIDPARIEGMGSNYQQLFKALPEYTVSTHLCEQVLGHISRERTLRRRVQLSVASLSITASAAGFLFAIPALIRAATESGFSLLASLSLTDSSIVAEHFSTFVFSLAETLPGIETLAVVLLMAVFLVSLRALCRAFPSYTFREALS